MLKDFRMLKMAFRSRLNEILTVPQGYASGFLSPAALLKDHFEHPPVNQSLIQNGQMLKYFSMLI